MYSSVEARAERQMLLNLVLYIVSLSDGDPSTVHARSTDCLHHSVRVKTDGPNLRLFIHLVVSSISNDCGTQHGSDLSWRLIYRAS